MVIGAKRYDIPLLISTTFGQCHDVVCFEVYGTSSRLEARCATELARAVCASKHRATDLRRTRIRRSGNRTFLDGIWNGELIDEGRTIGHSLLAAYKADLPREVVVRVDEP